MTSNSLEDVAIRVAAALGEDECVLIGGLAVGAHGYVRATTDVDFVVRDLDAASKRLRERGGSHREARIGRDDELVAPGVAGDGPHRLQDQRHAGPAGAGRLDVRHAEPRGGVGLEPAARAGSGQRGRPGQDVADADRGARRGDVAESAHGMPRAMRGPILPTTQAGISCQTMIASWNLRLVTLSSGSLVSVRSA